MGCHYLLRFWGLGFFKVHVCRRSQSFNHVRLFCDPIDYRGLPGSTVHGTSQARILGWVSIFFSRGSSWPRGQTHFCISCIGRWILYHWSIWDAFIKVRKLLFRGKNWKPVERHWLTTSPKTKRPPRKNQELKLLSHRTALWLKERQDIYWGFPCDSAVKNLLPVQGTGVWPLGQKDPLEKEMATHSSILAWKIPWTEEPGGLHTVHGVTKSQTRLSN